MAMRRVMVSEQKWLPGYTSSVVREVGERLFHCWGSDFTEFNEGPCGNSTVAIVEHPVTGVVEKIQPHLIRFLDKP